MRLALFTLCCVVLGALAHPVFAKPRGASFIYVRGGNDSVLMSGDTDDLERVRKALEPQDRALWARTADRKEYIVRDSATLDELEATWKTANELSERLGTLGKEQGKYGEQLGKLGEQVGKLGLRQGQLGLQLVNATDAQRAAIEREMRELDGKMQELQKQMKVFEKPMRKLENQMRDIQPKQNAAVKQAETATDALLSRAIASGVAKPF